MTSAFLLIGSPEFLDEARNVDLDLRPTWTEREQLANRRRSGALS
jgi:hypothetical protein